MNEYRLDDLYVGQKEEFGYTVTEEEMEMFSSLTGDVNPLHMDGEYAVRHGYKGRVAFGMLTASLVSTLGGCFLPGKYCLIRGVEVRFAGPVYIGDRLTVTGEVSRVDTSLRYLEVKVTITNQEKKKVLRGLMKAGVFDE